MSTDEIRISLRVVVPAEDGTAVIEITGPAVPENGLQAFGDWVLAALEQHADGAAEAARRMIAALRERDWAGDDALADQLDALLRSRTMPDLRPLPVDLDELAGILEGDLMYGGGRIDLATGEVWPAPAVDYAREMGQEDEDESDDPGRWLWVHCEGSRDGYRDMELFIGTVRDPGRADRLEIAISGRGRSGGSRTSWRVGPGNWIGGMGFPRSVSVARPGPGWPTPGTTSARGFLPHDPACLSARGASACRLRVGGRVPLVGCSCTALYGQTPRRMLLPPSDPGHAPVLVAVGCCLCDQVAVADSGAASW
jgi:hypothetical protein